MILTGAVAVVPDTSGLARVGETAVSGKVSGRGDSQFGTLKVFIFVLLSHRSVQS